MGDLLHFIAACTNNRQMNEKTPAMHSRGVRGSNRASASSGK